jgi:hypothetical protein
MASFSVTDAAFAGFRLMRERPKVIGAWAAFMFVGSLISAALAMVTGVSDGVAKLQALETAGNTDPRLVMAALADMGPFFLVLVGFSLAFYAILFAAAYRAYLNPQDTAVGALRFGADEVRMGGWLVTIFLAWLAYLFLVAFTFLLVVAVARSLGGPLSALVDLIAIGAMICALVYPAIRLSLAGPMTMASGKVTFVRSWRLTEGQFWRLLSAYFLTTAVLVLVSLLWVIIMVAILAVLALAMGGGLDSVAGMAKPDMTSLSAYFAPGTLVYLILNAMLSAAALAIFTGPSAEAYRALAAQAPPSTAQTFS